MKHLYIFFLSAISFFVAIELGAAPNDKFAYGRHPRLSFYISADTPEIYAGELATFTVTVKNYSDKSFGLKYKSGQQWDLAVFYNGNQTFRWSQGLTWEEREYTVPLKRGETKTKKLAWRSVDRFGAPLPQGVYSVRGMVMVEPRYLVTEDCLIRLLPPKVASIKTINAKINVLFGIDLPRYSKKKEIAWKIRYKYNDNRIDVHKISKTADTVKIMFKPKRCGHVEFDFYGYPDVKNETESVERRSYRVEVKDDL